MIDTIKNYIKSKGIKEYEVYISNLDVLSLNIRKSKNECTISGTGTGLGIRIAENKKLGFCSVNNIPRYKPCVNNAIKIARLNQQDKKFVSFVSPASYPSVKSYDKRLLDFNEDDINSLLKDYLKIIHKINPKITVIEGGYIKSKMRTQIANSEGLDIEKEKVYNQYSAELMIKRITTGFSDNAVSVLDPTKIKEYAKILKTLAKKEQAKTANYSVIFHPEAIHQFLSTTFEFSVNGENTSLKKSIWAEKLNQQVISGNITIQDNPLQDMMVCTQPFDDEGTSSKNKDIISKGVLKTVLFDSYNALYQNKQSTGNAERDFSAIPSIAPTNTIMLPGKKPVHDLISDIKNGVYIRFITSDHTIDQKTGAFSQGIGEGYIIKNGKFYKAIKETMVAGNFYEMLNQDVELSKETKEIGSYKLPYMFIPQLKIIGK